MRDLNHHEPPLKLGPGGDYTRGSYPGPIEWRLVFPGCAVAGLAGLAGTQSTYLGLCAFFGIIIIMLFMVRRCP